MTEGLQAASTDFTKDPLDLLGETLTCLTDVKLAKQFHEISENGFTYDCELS